MQRPLIRAHPSDMFTFQSSSGQKAGCNSGRRGDRGGFMRVSILIRPEGRMQRRGAA